MKLSISMLSRQKYEWSLKSELELINLYYLLIGSLKSI